MFDCPNCGETLRDDATFCPYCGSDAETGWNPDVDYYSLELPEDDTAEYEPATHYPEDPRARLHSMIGPTAIVLCFILFVSVGYRLYQLWILPAALFLMAMTFICLRIFQRPHVR